MVSSNPAIIGGEKLSANFRPGIVSSGLAARVAFLYTAQAAMQKESTASPIHVASQGVAAWRPDAMTAASTAVTPIATPPQPGTAVKADAPSIVSRMYRRLSIARS